MFFKLVSRNSRRSRKENGLFFSSLLISIMAFYMILSLSNQDVIRFLKEMESAGIEKLLLLVPLFYGLTLFILFFLIYYASRFQLKRREHEFGVYLMMGMSRGKLFFMLLAEDLRSSFGALFVGLPCAVLLSELISLITARLVGLGIIGHRFSFSLQAVLFTAVGFLLIKLLAFLILSVKITGQEVGSLLHGQPEGAKRTLPHICYLLFLAVGLLLLVHAFYLVISGLSWMGLKPMAQTLAEGVLGMFLFFGGLRYPLGWIAGRKSSRRGLQVFNFRQLFYVVAASYITIYLAIIFLVVANTIIGVQFLMSQQKTGRRYQTLIRLGAVYEVLRRSANTQINWYFGIPVAVAAAGSLFGVRGLLKGLLSSAFQEDFSTMTQILLVSAAMIVLLCVVELLYMYAVKRSSSRYLLSLMVPGREE